MNEPNFVWDKEKMKDFGSLSKEDFLDFYSYLTEEEYDNTVKILNDPHMEELISILSNSSVPYGVITVEYTDNYYPYDIYIEGRAWNTRLDYSQTKHDLINLITGYQINNRIKREDTLKERKKYVDLFWKYLDAASPEIIAGYFLYDYGDDAYDRWMECADEFEPAEREIVTNIISKLGKGE